MSEPFRLDNKTIIVTGASSGIGRQCAISCSNMGAKVILLGRNSDRLKETMVQMHLPAQHLSFSVDLVDYANIQNVIGQITGQVDRIDGLINCAGISTTLPFNMNKPEKMEGFFHANVSSAMNLTRLMIKQPKSFKDGSAIVFISSVMGIVGETGKSLYSMTKGAIIAASRSLAIELAPRNIRVNCISPGVVESPMSQSAIYSSNEDSLNKIKGMHPLGLGQPEDVANAAVYLLSDASVWVTGINLIVDGGYTAR